MLLSNGVADKIGIQFGRYLRVFRFCLTPHGQRVCILTKRIFATGRVTTKNFKGKSFHSSRKRLSLLCTATSLLHFSLPLSLPLPLSLSLPEYMQKRNVSSSHIKANYFLTSAISHFIVYPIVGEFLFNRSRRCMADLHVLQDFPGNTFRESNLCKPKNFRIALRTGK